MGDRKGKPDKKSINKKPSELDEECGIKTKRLYCQWINFSTWTKDRKRKIENIWWEKELG